jgi:hypothetical protein
MKIIRNTILVIAAIGGLMSASADELVKMSDFNNKKVVTLTRLPATADSCGLLSYEAGNSNVTTVVSPTTVSDNSMWVLYNNSVDGYYYLYNIGAKQCLNLSGSNCTFATSGTNVSLEYLTNNNCWLVQGNNKLVGLHSQRLDAAYFLRDMTNESNVGFFFRIESADRTLTGDEVKEMEAIVNSDRQAKIDAYKAFVKGSKELNNDGYTYYLGSNNIDALDKALADGTVESMSLTKLEELKQAALYDALPISGCYYRIKNFLRPNSGKHNNYMNLTTSLTTLQTQGNVTTLGTGSSGTGENLRLFQLIADGGNRGTVKMKIAALNKYWKETNASTVAAFDDTDAGVFELERYDELQRTYRLKFKGTNKRITTGGQREVVPVTIIETAQLWYIERVDTIVGPTMAKTGCNTVILPCAVDVPDGFEVYYPNICVNNCLNMIRVRDVIPANTPFLIKGTAGATAIFKIHTGDVAPLAAPKEGKNLFDGTNVAIASTTNKGPYYVLSSTTDNQPVLKSVATVNSWTANSVYILADNIPTTSDVLTLDFTGSTSGIDNISADKNAKSDIMYDLSGRRVYNPSPGTIVVDSAGNKYIVP